MPSRWISRTWTGNWRVSDTFIINASPLIFLGRAGHLDLLQGLSEGCFVPEPVRAEILRRGEGDPTVRAMAARPWLISAVPPPIPETVAAWGLGPGESSVLALALAELSANTVAVIDDLAARRCATTLGIPLRGTLGIILVAKKRGLIPLARPVLERLIIHGMYLSRPALDQALARVGE